MPNYRRLFVPGGTYFFTVNAADRRGSLLTDHIDVLRQAFRTVKARHPFDILAMVVLPDHLHTVWRLPPGDVNFSARWRRIKSEFSKAIPCPDQQDARPGRGLWQDRFWEHMIRSDEDLANHIHYCHINPVKHGLCDKVADWPYSSFRRDMAQGVLPQGWEPDTTHPLHVGEP